MNILNYSTPFHIPASNIFSNLFIAMKKTISVLLLIMSFTGLASVRTLAQGSQMSVKEINKWYKEKSWMNGLKREPHKSINKVEFARQYNANKTWWEKAFAYLRETDLSKIQPGRYAIEGENVFAIVSDGQTKELDKTMWEAHKNYQDIHFVISGKEKIGITPVASASISKEYDASKDIAFFTSKGKYYESSPDNFFIMFTQDAHRPGVKAEGAETVKKVVIKIRKSA